MAKKHSSLLWDTHASYLTSGLTRLQQNEEFVDMTLGVEGYFVKVHKSVIALASPYLKEVIKSLNCSHPVIFLHNISKDILSYLLEYIYIGEVVVPNDHLGLFIKNAKELHIAGIETKFLSMVNHKTCDETVLNKQLDSHSIRPIIASDELPTIEELSNTAQRHVLSESNAVLNMPIIISEKIIKPADVTMPINIDLNDRDNIVIQDQDVPDATNIRDSEPNDNSLNSNKSLIDMENIIPENQITKDNSIDIDVIEIQENEEPTASSSEVTRNIIIPVGYDPELGARNIVISTDVPPDQDVSGPVNTGQQYTVSNQGSMQMILNRYIYCVHHRSGNKGIKRRWRCMDYRRKGCKAYLDTIGENISDRVNAHIHPFHDSTILKRVKKGLVFTSIENAEENSTSRHVMEEPSHYDVDDDNFAPKKNNSRKRKI